MNNNSESWGMYNTMYKKFVFGICTTSPRKAREALYNKIGKSSFKWRYEPRKLPVELVERYTGGNVNKRMPE